ncbi:MAG: DUF1016 family protein [Armatimonadetes bacterium]|nr:DUF1016 family protein [Armatimonadota bacterium]
MSSRSPIQAGLSDYEAAITALREKLPSALSHPDVGPIAAAKEQVIGHYGPLFRADSLGSVNLDEFRSFLDFRNNRHWGGLHRQVGFIFADPPALRNVLYVLADEGRPVEERIDNAVAGVQGMGKAIITAFLHVAYPEKYAVWNNTAEGALKQIGLWPAFDRGATVGAKYSRINDLIKRISADLELDLWTLDAVWWALVQPEVPQPPVVTPKETSTGVTPPGQAFGLERHLHEFLVDNWAGTELASEWDIYSEDGDRLTGIEYPCAVGYIDILCRHKTQTRWLVIELKRGQTSDATVGQVLRYMGWVGKELASADEKVEGLVIAHSGDNALKYALSPLPNVRLMLYEVEFRLTSASG